MEDKENLTKKSFFITRTLIYICLGIIIFSTFFAKTQPVKNILYLEILICVISSIIYTFLTTKIRDSENKKNVLDWNDFSKKRYFGWIFSTPAMLLVLCIILSLNADLPIQPFIIGIIIVLDMIMLYIGYSGEEHKMDKMKAMIWGFVPFVVMFGLIFVNYVLPRTNTFNLFLFIAYLIFWATYGLVYLLDDHYKNIVMNGLDFTAKGLIGVIICYFYIWRKYIS